jgi:4-amino-4-deoxy-L-arabinose transferase-like glycosyltransferase
LLLYSIRDAGLWLTSDSISYVTGAQNIANGDGYTGPDGEPLVLWPPMLSALLAAPELLGVSASNAAAVLNVVATAVLVAISGVVLSRLARPAIAAAGTMMVAFAYALQHVGSHLWSEPLFDLLVLAALVLAARVAGRPQLRTTAWLGLLVAAAVLTRYAGVVLLPAAATAVLLPLRSWADRARHLAVLAAASSLPVAGWLARNERVASALTGERDGASVGLAARRHEVLETVTRWFLPLHDPGPARTIAVVLVVLCVAAVVPAWLSRRRTTWIVLAVFLATGLPVMAVITDAAGADRLDDRLLAPFVAPLLLLVTLSVDSLLDLVDARAPAVSYGVASVLLVACVLPAAETLRQDPTDIEPAFAPYNSAPWLDHPAVVAARAARIPADAFVISNRGYGIGHTLDRPVQESPTLPTHFATRRVVTPADLTRRLSAGEEVYLVWLLPDFGHLAPDGLPGLRAQPIDVTEKGGLYRLSLAVP